MIVDYELSYTAIFIPSKLKTFSKITKWGLTKWDQPLTLDI